MYNYSAFADSTFVLLRAPTGTLLERFCQKSTEFLTFYYNRMVSRGKRQISPPPPQLPLRTWVMSLWMSKWCTIFVRFLFVLFLSPIMGTEFSVAPRNSGWVLSSKFVLLLSKLGVDFLETAHGSAMSITYCQNREFLFLLPSISYRILLLQSDCLKYRWTLPTHEWTRSN